MRRTTSNAVWRNSEPRDRPQWPRPIHRRKMCGCCAVDLPWRIWLDGDGADTPWRVDLGRTRAGPSVALPRVRHNRSRDHEPGHPLPCRGYVIIGPEITILVDPPFGADGGLQELPRGLDPAAVLLTNHFHIRSAGEFRTEFGCDVYLHAAEESWTDFKADSYFSDGDILLDHFRDPNPELQLHRRDRVS